MIYKSVIVEVRAADRLRQLLIRIVQRLAHTHTNDFAFRTKLQYSLVKADTSGGHFLSGFKRFRLTGVKMT